MSTVRSGILLTAFGGPDCLDAVGPFMAGLMHREPSAEMITRAQAKYEAIGGKSPLAEIAGRIAIAIEKRFAEEGRPVPVRVGMRYWTPYIADAMSMLVETGAERIVVASLSAFESKVAGGAYREAAHSAAAESDISDICEMTSLHEAPGFRKYLSDSLKDALDTAGGARPLVVMTAHSLPLSDLEHDDPYVVGLKDVADVISANTDMGPSAPIVNDDRLSGIVTFGCLDGPVPWVFAYQSKGLRPGAWLEPDLDEVIAAAANAGYDEIIISPVGFATDHMETLYDLDIVAKGQAIERGLGFVRASVPNDDPVLIDAFVELLRPLISEG